MIILFAGRLVRGAVFASAASGRWDLRLKIVSARAAGGGSAGLNVKRALRFNRFRLGVSFALVGVGGGGDCPYSGMESVARVRVVDVFVRIGARFVRIGARFVRFFVLLSMNLGESAQIGEFGKRHHRVFRHSRWRRRHGKNKDILE